MQYYENPVLKEMVLAAHAHEGKINENWIAEYIENHPEAKELVEAFKYNVNVNENS